MDNTNFITPIRETANHPTVTPPTTDNNAPPAPLRIHRSPPRERVADNNGSVLQSGGANEETTKEETALVAYMMYNTGHSMAELPELKVEAWPHGDQRPNPISISMARKLLAAAYAAIPCEVPGAGVHGHAWIIETDNDWLERDGATATIVTPTKPLKSADYSIVATLKYSDEMSMFKLYNHLMQEGKQKIVTWFGKSMFDDLHKNGILPNTVTAKELLEHLEKTYSQSYDQRRYLEQVEKDLNAAYDPKKPVETYFMKLQEARTNSALLGQPYTEMIVMNKALKQFDKHYGKDAYKAEKKWNERTDKEKSWLAFKEYWKGEIHQWELVGKVTKQANEAVLNHVDTLSQQMQDMKINMSALQAESRSVREENDNLMAKHVHINHALQAEQQRRNGSSGGSDDLSTLTDFLDKRLERFDALNAAMDVRITELANKTQNRDSHDTTGRRTPASYAHLNNGKGRKFNKYCWQCGVNCTHWTRKCRDLTEEQKGRYRDADFDNTMGGSTKFMDRRGKYQCDYRFDSL